VANRTAFSVGAAREAARRGELSRWVAEFLSSEGSDNAALAAQLSERRRWWLGPVRLRLNWLNRLAGPEGDPVLCPVDDDAWGENVDDMEQNIEAGWEPPPLIVSYDDGRLVLEDGNHRVESLRRAGARDGWAVVGFTDPEERDAFTVPAEDDIP
jgi:hypothetical protein